ncbi:MAG: hypothetical protein ACK5MY_06370 [Jhaorihella sp.]
MSKEGATHAHNPHYATRPLHLSLQSLSAKVAVDLNGPARP